MKKKILILGLLIILNIILIGCQIDLTKPTLESTTTTNITTTTQNTTTTTTQTTTTHTSTTTTTEQQKEYDSIADVKNGPVGYSYKVRATVVGTTQTGVLIYDGADFIYVYLGSTPTISVYDYVEVNGKTSIYAGAVQFTTNTTITKLSTGTSINFIPIELYGKEIDQYTNQFKVGDYIKLTGNIEVSSTYINLQMANTSVTSTLLSNTFNLNVYNNKEVEIEGFVLYVTGIATKYLNVLVTKVTEKITNFDYLPLTILSINDLHGYIEQDSNGKSGLSNMAYLINEIRDANSLNDVVLIANGDMFQGTAISNLKQGLSVINAMNLMGFDMMGIGNHEFDWGIETILQYFDNILENGEANFPLINSNIYERGTNQLLTVENGNVFDSIIINREGINIGIMSYIGDVYSSIQYDKVENYYFDLNFRTSIKNLGKKLKNQGADIIILNLHDYDDYIYDNLAFITDDNGEYLLDAIIAGHTHSYVKQSIKRVGDYLPVIQAASYGRAMGKIILKIDMDTKEVTESNLDIVYASDAGTNYDPEIEALIREYQEELQLDEALVYAGETVGKREDLYQWIGSVLLKSVDADIAISNTGGVRSTGNIINNKPVTIKHVFEVYPFDNEIYIITAKYRDIKSFLRNNNIFYSTKDGVTFKDNEYYRIAVISYVYYWDNLKNVRSSNDIKTDLILLHLLIEDLEMKGKNAETFKPIANPYASIEVKYQ